MYQKKIAIIGNGVYGSALGYLFSQKHTVHIYGRTPRHPHDRYIHDFHLTREKYDYVVFSVTTVAFPEVYASICQYIPEDTHIILAMKGLTSDGLLPYQSTERISPHPHLSLLSGPGFADEILADIPVHLVLATVGEYGSLVDDFLLDRLTLDFSHDVVGVGWCGVLKNIYAIGAGIVSSKGSLDREIYTHNASHELEKILEIISGIPETAFGPAGLGDIWICTTPHSRNFRFGASLDMSIASQAEGYNAAGRIREVFPFLMTEKYPLIASILQKIENITL